MIYSNTNKCWYIENTRENYFKIKQCFEGKAIIDETELKAAFAARKGKPEGEPKLEIKLHELHPEAKKWLEKYDCFLSSKRFSEHTRRTYNTGLKQFFNYYHKQDPMELSHEDVNYFNHHYVVARNLSVSFQRQIISAIKLFYNYAKGHRLEVDKVVYPKKEHKLPKVVSKEDIKLMIDKCTNLKHKTILMTLYGTGVRMSELLNLRIIDIDSKREVINIMNGKGRKDREVPLTPYLLKQLRIYVKACRPKEFLFEGQFGGQYSSSSVNEIIYEMKKRAGINIHLSAHTFRHCYATHMHEMGIDIRYIQTLMGHKSSKTTEIYTFVSTASMKQLKNPLDELNLDEGNQG